MIIYKNKNYKKEEIIVSEGVLELMGDGYGFIRFSSYNYLTSPDDIFVSNVFVKLFSLRTGDTILCQIRPPKNNEKYFTLTKIISINKEIANTSRRPLLFEHLIPLFPTNKFDLDKKKSTISTRIIDLFCPIGKGQRALFVAPPKAGKTTLIKDCANCISINHPETYIIVLLVDERPEEVTDMKRNVSAEVVSSTFDEPAERHVRVANIVLEKSMRMVECGYDVVILLDSITRLTRAYNVISPISGKILSGGIDSHALQKPKKFFGSARNIESGGSLSIIATAVIDTGSKMDDIIFEEFKGTGNMELQLDRRLANKRIFPAINIVVSGTRREDLLVSENKLQKVSIIRDMISKMNIFDAMNLIKSKFLETKNNKELLNNMNN